MVVAETSFYKALSDPLQAIQDLYGMSYCTKAGIVVDQAAPMQKKKGTKTTLPL